MWSFHRYILRMDSEVNRIKQFFHTYLPDLFQALVSRIN